MKARPKIEDYRFHEIVRKGDYLNDLSMWAKEAEQEIKEWKNQYNVLSKTAIMSEIIAVQEQQIKELKAIDHRTIKVKWWGVMYLRMKYYYLSIVRRLLRKEYCKVCGQELTEIRGRYPKEPRRKVCACCATEKLEWIEEQNNVEAKCSNNA